MGAPPTGSRRARAARADFTNRRREIKFAATDLKLYRRRQETSIEHWDVWRSDAPPRTYFLWAARMAPTDSLTRMLEQLRILTDTYLEGAGIVAWQLDERKSGYEALELPASERARQLDDVLHRIASTIRRLAPDGRPPEPVVHEDPDERSS